MDLILVIIASLVVFDSVDRHLHPEEYAVAKANEPRRKARSVRQRLGRVLRGAPERAPFAASHRCSITQVSPWLTSEPQTRVTVRH